VGAALVLGDPAFDGGLFPSLPRLPGAAAEAVSIAALYPGARLLTGEAATKERFLAAAPQAELIHVGTHALSDRAAPWLSMLLLAPSSADNHGVLTAGALLDHRLTKTRLVVLAACDTAAGRLLRNEGSSSVATAFFVAGAQAVVETLLDIPDAAAGPLLQTLHREVREGVDPAVALRTAQLESLRAQGPGKLPTWAAFQVVGGASLANSGTGEN
jgi:CHAT domain-containing protein